MTEYERWIETEKYKQEKAKQLQKMKFTREYEGNNKKIETNGQQPRTK